MKLKTKKVCDLSKSWLPFYDSTIEDPQVKEWMRAVANGGKLDVVDGEVVIENEGDGGILFIDEFTRMSPDGVKSIFTLLSNRMIGSNITLGDKWICRKTVHEFAVRISCQKHDFGIYLIWF